ncbi:MFS transporter [Paenibacillus thermotolerans]|uniref:MFS transporter n=1 Tax=Paenibacillus thermotolerans TaxID=3027807 RepID=UPI0023686551|nr:MULTISPECIES: MFS transporter [unclassified Paenibacillus]
MSNTAAPGTAPARPAASTGAGTQAAKTVFPIILAVSLMHMLNDTMQAVIPAIAPVVKESLALTYTQIGFILFALNMTSSVLQPLIGFYSDKKPSPYKLPIGMTMSLLGMVGVAFAPNYALLLVSVVFVGLGSAIFHPEGSKVIYLSSGNRRGLAQSLYQVGGNGGSSTGPLMTKYIFYPFGQAAAIWFTLVAAVGAAIAFVVSRWYKSNLHLREKPKPEAQPNYTETEKTAAAAQQPKPKAGIPRYVWFGLGLLVLLVFARSTYHAAIANYYQYFYATTYGETVEHAQIPLFLFGILGVVGTFLGGPLADRFGARHVIFVSMAGAAPFALLLPFVSQFWVVPVMMALGLILALGFSVTVVYAQQLLPNHIGTASGLIVGLAFGMGALGAVVLGGFADAFGLKAVMIGACVLPLLGILTYKLPDPE